MTGFDVLKCPKCGGDKPELAQLCDRCTTPNKGNDALDARAEVLVPLDEVLESREVARLRALVEALMLRTERPTECVVCGAMTWKPTVVVGEEGERTARRVILDDVTFRRHVCRR